MATRFDMPRAVWEAGARPTEFRPLDGDVTVDVAIVGGGLTGLLCAEALATQGAKVAIFEARSIGGGSTGNSTGNLYALVGERHGRTADDHLPAVLRARANGVDTIERLARDLGIECAFVRCPWTLFATSDEGRAEVERAAKVADLGSLRRMASEPTMPFATTTAIAVERQAQFNPLLFTQGLARRMAETGVGVYEHTRMESFDAKRKVVHLANGDVHCQTIVLATHTPKGQLRLHTEMSVNREYGIAAPVDREVLAPGIYWNAEEPFRSVRPYRAQGRDYIVVVGESHRTGEREDTDACIAALEATLRVMFPGAGEVAYRWSAQNYRSADGLPFIGASAYGEDVLVATGYAADGLTYAAVAARMIADRLGGHAHPLADAFDPRRKAVGKRLVEEAINTVKQFARDLPGVGAHDVDAIPPGGGAVVDRLGEKIAVHRDASGALHAVSAVCTHMQCIVRWNHAERSWDCPCHGSRFATDGSVIEGPALSNLAACAPPSR